MSVDWVANALRQHPELALFLTLAIGYALGKIRFGSVQLGAVTGVLITGVIIGQLGVAISPDLKSASFLLFLFSIGYKTEPQFVKRTAYQRCAPGRAHAAAVRNG